MIALLAGCLTQRDLDPDAPCVEAGLAISRRTFDCTGNPDLANRRYERFEREARCLPVDYVRWVDTDEFDSGLDDPPNFFHCAFAVGELSCELVEDYGDELALYLTASPVCPYVVELE